MNDVIKKNMKTITCGLSLLLLVACQQATNKQVSSTTHYLDSNPEVISIDMNDKENALPLDSLFELTSFVKLETTGDNLIGGVWDILFFKDRIVIEDMQYSNSITVYDENGHYLNKISNKGQGPDEYVYLDYITKTLDGSALMITDVRKNMTFNLNGDFMGSFPLPFSKQYSLEFLDQETVINECPTGIPLEGNKNYRPQIVATDMDKNILYSAFQSDYTEKNHSIIIHPLRRFGNQLFYMPSYNDTIFQLKKEGIAAYYILDIKRKGEITQNDKESSQLLEKKLNELSAYFEGHFVELNDYAIFRIVEPRMDWSRFVIYAKDRKKTFYCNGTFYDARLRFSVKQRFLYKDNIFVTCVFPTDIIPFKKEMYRLCKTKAMKKEIDRLYENLTEDDNPVLFFYRIKI